MTLTERIQSRADCGTCGGARLSGTGHKVWCSGHILAERPLPAYRAVPRWMEWTREHQNERTAYSDLTGYLR